MTVVVLAMRQKILRKPMKDKIEIDTGFKVISIDDLNLVPQICSGEEADVALIEVSNKEPSHIDDGIKMRYSILEKCPKCKVIFLCDPKNADLGDKVIELKKGGVIDAFIYSDASYDFLAATIKSLVT